MIALTAILVSLLGSGTASAANVTANETRVGAPTPTTVQVAGPHESIATTTYDNPMALVCGAPAADTAQERAWCDSGALGLPRLCLTPDL